LAGVSIATLTNSGLFDKAKQAKEKSENSQIKEETTLGDYENKIGEYVDGTRQNATTSKSENYSPEETEIGTWIDGSKLYRKVVEFTSTGSSDSSIVVTLPSNCVIRKFDGYIMAGNDKIPLNWYWTSSDYMGTYVELNNSLRQRTGNPGYRNKPGSVILEYTKTAE